MSCMYVKYTDVRGRILVFATVYSAISERNFGTKPYLNTCIDSGFPDNPNKNHRSLRGCIWRNILY